MVETYHARNAIGPRRLTLFGHYRDDDEDYDDNHDEADGDIKQINEHFTMKKIYLNVKGV